jgi:hypothetical protein
MAGHIPLVIPTLSQTTVAIGPPFILLTFQEAFNNSHTGLPMGGGKAGANRHKNCLLVQRHSGAYGSLKLPVL